MDDDEFEQPSNQEWARHGAQLVLRHEDSAAISTAHYIECGFILAAARVCLESKEFAEAIGAMMEPARQASHVPVTASECP